MDVCKLEDFKHAFMLMDELIDNEINSGNDEYKETDPLIVKAIGGFALLYHELRLSAVTADVDSTVMIPNCYKNMIKKTAKQLDMPEDWLNDHSQSGIAAIDGKWDPISWNLKHIQIYVLNTRELMIDKCGWAEKNLSGSMLTDRDEVKDLNDFLGILWKLNIQYDTIDELTKALERFDIDLNEYPNVKKYIEDDLNGDGLYWPDGHI